MQNKLIFGLALIGALAACSTAANSDGNASATMKRSCQSGASHGDSPAGLNQIELCVDTGKAVKSFVVELAVTPQQQAQGLMFRTELSDDKGMLFPFANQRILSFWMKNTVISLDIIFIRSDGTIANIAANAEPYSLDPLSSDGMASAVLELRGGLAQELGIKPNHKVSWKK